MTFEDKKEKFIERMSQEEGYKVLTTVTKIISKLGGNFLSVDGGELSDIQMKLSGYKYYLSDYIAEYQRMAEYHSLEIKNIRAEKWEEVSERIKAEKGKVSNKEQIENEILQITREHQIQKVLYENYYNNFKIKMSAMNDVITTIAQRLAELKRHM